MFPFLVDIFIDILIAIYPRHSDVMFHLDSHERIMPNNIRRHSVSTPILQRTLPSTHVLSKTRHPLNLGSLTLTDLPRSRTSAFSPPSDTVKPDDDKSLAVRQQVWLVLPRTLGTFELFRPRSTSSAPRHMRIGKLLVGDVNPAGLGEKRRRKEWVGTAVLMITQDVCEASVPGAELPHDRCRSNACPAPYGTLRLSIMYRIN